MAFSFGGTSGTASAPAPSFTFGSNAANTPTPGTSLNNTATTAPSTGFSFGNPAPAPATGASTGFSFGNPAPAPSTGASTGFSFGNPAPAPSSSGGGLFGSNPAPAPSAGGGLFGTSSANPTTNSTSSFFGSANNSSLTTTAATTNAATPNATPGAGQSLTGASQFSTLPPQAQSAVTQIYELVAKHRRTMASVSKMEPKVLSASWLENGNTDHIEEEKKTDGLLVSAGEGLSSSSSLEDEYLPLQCEALRSDFQIVSSKIERSVACAHELRIRAKENSDHGRTEAVWPIEALAARRGVQLTFLNDKGEPLSEKEKLEKKYNELMDKEASLIDRKEVVPSDFMWKLLKTFEEQLRLTQKEVEVLRGQLDMFEASNADIGRGYERQTARNATRDEIASIYNNNQRAMIRIAGEVAFVTEQLGELRSRWRRYHGPNDDPFKKAETQLLIKQNEEDAKLRAIMLSSKANVAANSTGVSTGGSLFGNTTASTQSTGLFGGPAPSSGGGLFGNAPSAAPSTGLFGAPAPANNSGGIFGAKSPAPLSGGLFGAQAPTPSTGFSFGNSAPAPSIFGSTPASAPTGGGLFGAPTPANNVGSFGAPTPASGGLFGSNAAPASGSGLFGATAPSSGLSRSRTKGKGRSRR